MLVTSILFCDKNYYFTQKVLPRPQVPFKQKNHSYMVGLTSLSKNSLIFCRSATVRNHITPEAVTQRRSVKMVFLGLHFY